MRAWRHPLGPTAAASTLALILCAGCRGAPAAPAPDAGPPPPPAAVIYSYLDDDGRIRMAARLEDIPEAARARVVVSDTAAPAAERLGRDRALLLDARAGEAHKNFSLVDLRAMAKARTRSGPARDPGSLGRAAVDTALERLAGQFGVRPAAAPAGVVLYETSWCGFCRKARAWLRARRVSFEARDVEADPQAAAELEEKLRQAGIEDAGVPVIDVRGRLLVGFDPDRLAELLQSPPP